MTRFVGLVAALLFFGVSAQDAKAGAPALAITALGCVDSQVGSCEFGNPNGPYDVSKLFLQPAPLTLFGTALGQGTSAPVVEIIDNMTGGNIFAYHIMLSTVGANGIAAFNDNGGDLHLLNPILGGATGSCNLMGGNMSIFCSGMNVPTGNSFGVAFNLMAMTPVRTGFTLVQGPASVPEPAALALLGLGLAGLAAARLRRRR